TPRSPNDSELLRRSEPRSGVRARSVGIHADGRRPRAGTLRPAEARTGGTLPSSGSIPVATPTSPREDSRKARGGVRVVPARNLASGEQEVRSRWRVETRFALSVITRGSSRVPHSAEKGRGGGRRRVPRHCPPEQRT